jgi:hypothetical protein
MRFFLAAAMVALLAGTAYAEDTSPPKSPHEIEAERATEQAYKKSLGNIPDKGPTDPWGNARSMEVPKDASKAAAKAPAKRVKTGSTAN